ncbi:Ephrin type-A receptor 2 [Hondaea fermentalgiana]|uniref:Ephrin type-A receptor 2 n=1 Tax=Hondaea fermentalgiana TaxID=2315210 RepID=A0A2R5GGI2_9STRA|nr:Ephrin type-A receptor 2 [Hondaea fermentalgiana]|eukprot:GBG30016.1 Ephrin type-A receptor 2 [Hondaea fermentalgiana]
MNSTADGACRYYGVTTFSENEVYLNAFADFEPIESRNDYDGSESADTDFRPYGSRLSLIPRIDVAPPKIILSISDEWSTDATLYLFDGSRSGLYYTSDPEFIHSTDVYADDLPFVDSGDDCARTFAFGDVNGDEALDWIVSCTGSAENYLLLFTGTDDAEFPDYNKQAEIKLAGVGADADGAIDAVLRAHLFDFTGDGLLDIILALESGQVHFLNNTGSLEAPTWTSAFNFMPPGFENTKARDLAITDVDGDGRMDVLLMSKSGIHTLQNIGTATWPEFVEPETEILSISDVPTSSGGLLSFLVYDFFNKGYDEIAIQAFDLQVTYLSPIPVPTPAFAMADEGIESVPSLVRWRLDSWSDEESVSFVDFDGDGDVDVLSVMANGSSGVLQYYRNEGIGGLVQTTVSNASSLASASHGTPHEGFNLPVSAASYITSASFVDLDDDGDMDMVLLLGDTQFAFYENVEGKYTYREEASELIFKVFFENIDNSRYLRNDMTNAAAASETNLKAKSIALDRAGNTEHGEGRRRTSGGYSHDDYGTGQGGYDGTSEGGYDGTGDDYLWASYLVFASMEFVNFEGEGLYMFVTYMNDDIDGIFKCAQFLYNQSMNSEFGSFTLTSSKYEHFPAGSTSGTLLFGDFDDDGAIDLVTGTSKTLRFVSDIQSGDSGESSRVSSFDLGLTWSFRLSAVDLDGDGDLDIVAESGSSGGEFYYSSNNALPALVAFINTAKDCRSECTGNRATCAASGSASEDEIFELAADAQGIASVAAAIGTCNCPAQFQGSACEQCASGRYGTGCKQVCPDRSTTNLEAGTFIFPDTPDISQCECLSPFVMNNDFECTCPAGSGYDETTDTCELCARGTFKSELGLDICTQCPGNSSLTDTDVAGATNETQCACKGNLELYDGECMCDAGYELDGTGQVCSACKVGYFKSSAGLGACEKCSTGFTTFSSGSASCEPDNCELGYERESANQTCVPCEIGTYRESLEDAACFPCPEGREYTVSTGTISIQDCLSYSGNVMIGNESISCYENEKLAVGAICEKDGLTVETLSIRQHYWRIANTSIDIRQCPRDSYCEPSNSSSRSLAQSGNEETSSTLYCSPYHTGIMCASCMEGYALNGESRCSFCSSSRQTRDKAKVVTWACIVIVIALLPALYVVHKSVKSRLLTARDVKSTSGGHSCLGRIMRFSDKMCGWRKDPQSVAQRLVASGRGKALILLKFGQIVFDVGVTVGMVGPGGSAAALVLNFNVGILFEFFAVGCAVSTNYYAVLVAVTLWPLVCALFLAVAALVCRRVIGPSISVSELATRVFTEILVFMYPGISACILSVFVYNAIEHEVDDDTPLRVLQRDPTIDFDSTTSQFMRIYAAVMIAVYPVGVVLALALGMPYAREDDEAFEILSQGLLFVLALGISTQSDIQIAGESSDPIILWVSVLGLFAFLVTTMVGTVRPRYREAPQNEIDDDGKGGSSMFVAKRASSGLPNNEAGSGGKGTEEPSIPGSTALAKSHVLDLDLEECNGLSRAEIAAPPNSPTNNSSVRPLSLVAEVIDDAEVQDDSLERT